MNNPKRIKPIRGFAAAFMELFNPKEYQEQVHKICPFA